MQFFYLKVMQLGFTPRNPQETNMSVFETGAQAILGGIISMIYNLVIDLAVTTMFFLSPMFCVKETVV